MIKEEKLSLAHVRQILELIDIENSMKVSYVQIWYFLGVSFGALSLSFWVML